MATEQLVLLGEATALLAEKYRHGEDLRPARDWLRGQQPKPSPIRKAKHLYGVHEGPLDWLGGVQGWLVDTVNVWWSAAGLNYHMAASCGHTVIARLNNGYYPAGTVPSSDRYDEFVRQAGLVVSRTPHCHIWQIGNEMNHQQERPDGLPILPQDYALCYKLCRDRIRQMPDHTDDEVAIGAVAPWNNQTTYFGNPEGDWIAYFQDVIREIGKLGCPIDAITLHTYTHTHNPDEVTSEQKMGAPFGHRRYQFRAYRDFLEALPADLCGLPVYITETDPCNSAWRDVNNGLVHKMYTEIDLWNREHPNGPRIFCLALYRGKKVEGDKWFFPDKAGVRQDFDRAKREGYTNR